MLTASPSLTTSSWSSVLLRRFRLAFGVAKGREIVLADQSLRGACIASVSSGRGSRQARPMSSARLARRLADPVEIMPLFRGEPRLEICPARFPPDSTPIGCGRRCAFSPSRNRPGTKCLAMSQCATCAERMHAGIGAARAVNANLLAADRLDRVFQRALHRRAVVLDLPAAERRAVIFDDEFVAGHQLSRIGGFSGVPRRNSSAFIGALPARCSSRMRIAPSPQATVR